MSPDRIPRRAAPLDAAPLARRALLVLTLINLVNYLDRYIVPALGQSLRTSSLHVNDTQFGLLTTGFFIVYILTAPVFGRLGDQGSRTRLIALGIFIWSLATVLGGLAWTFATLFLARALVGVGEAAYATISPSLLADYYARSTGAAHSRSFSPPSRSAPRSGTWSAARWTSISAGAARSSWRAPRGSPWSGAPAY